MSAPPLRYRRSTELDAQAVFDLVPASVACLAPDFYPQDVIDTWMEGCVAADYLDDCARGVLWIAEDASGPIRFAHGEMGEVKRLSMIPNAAGLVSEPG